MKPAPDSEAPRIIMQGIHVELTPALQQALHDKFETLIRHNPYIIRLNLRLHKTQQLGRRPRFRATAQVECRGNDLVAGAEGMEAYSTLDELSQKLDQQLERRHGRSKDKRNHPHGVEVASNLPKVGESPGPETLSAEGTEWE